MLLPAPSALVKAALVLAGRSDKAYALTENLKIDTNAAEAAGWRARISIAEAVEKAFAR